MTDLEKQADHRISRGRVLDQLMDRIGLEGRIYLHLVSYRTPVLYSIDLVSTLSRQNGREGTNSGIGPACQVASSEFARILTLDRLRRFPHRLVER